MSLQWVTNCHAEYLETYRRLMGPLVVGDPHVKQEWNMERKMYQRLQHKQSMQGLLLDMVQGSRDKLVV